MRQDELTPLGVGNTKLHSSVVVGSQDDSQTQQEQGEVLNPTPP